MNYANFQRTISLYKVLKISNIKALKTDSFFEQIFIPILNTLPERAKAYNPWYHEVNRQSVNTALTGRYSIYVPL